MYSANILDPYGSKTSNHNLNQTSTKPFVTSSQVKSDSRKKTSNIEYESKTASNLTPSNIGGDIRQRVSDIINKPSKTFEGGSIPTN